MKYFVLNELVTDHFKQNYCFVATSNIIGYRTTLLLTYL